MKKALLAAAFAVAAVLLVVLWRDGELAPAAFPGSLAAADAVSAPAVSPPRPPPSAKPLAEKLGRLQQEEVALKTQQSAAGTPIPNFKPEPGADDPGPGEEYIQRYQGRSGRLSPNARPDGAEVTTRIPSVGPAPALVIWVPSVRVQAGAQVVIHATVLDEAGAPLVPESLGAAIAPQGGKPGPEQALLPAAPGEFALAVRAPPPGQYEFQVRATGTFHGEPYARAAGGAFMVHAAGGHLEAAAARCEKRGGDLALLIPAQIDQPGNYWMYAELWGGPAGSRPIAFARDRFEHLPAGARTLSISFGGAVLHDSGIDGPYLVRNLRFQQVDAFPPQEQEPVPQLPPTQAFLAAGCN